MPILIRKHVRIKGILPVRLYAVTAAGRTLLQMAHTLDVSEAGACLGGVRAPVDLGQIVELEYKTNRARYRVVWMQESPVSNEKQIGLECLQPLKRIWGADMPRKGEGAAQAQPSRSAQPRTRRAYSRYAVAYGAEVRNLNAETGHWTKLTNLSIGGCYCETTAPLEPFTRVRLLLRLDDTDIDVYGVVRCSHAFTGMGIQFTEFVRATEAKRLQAVLDRLHATNA